MWYSSDKKEGKMAEEKKEKFKPVVAVCLAPCNLVGYDEEFKANTTYTFENPVKLSPSMWRILVEEKSKVVKPAKVSKSE